MGEVGGQNLYLFLALTTSLYLNILGGLKVFWIVIYDCSLICDTGMCFVDIF